MVVGLLLTACTPGEDAPPRSPWPLTGLPDFPEDLDRPVLMVKVDDSAAGRPQRGLGEADLVVQEMVEGGATRLAAMYHSTLPTAVEPVRSVRLTDIGIVKPTGGTIAASGGETSTVDAVRDAGINLVTEGAHFARDSSRPAPYNLVLDAAELAPTLPAGAPSQPYFRFSDSGEVPEDAVGDAVSAVELSWPLGGSSWTYDGAAEAWQRTDLADNEGFAFTNLVVLTLDVTFQGGTDASGTPIPTMVTSGSGPGVVAVGGTVYPVTWSKANDAARWSLDYAPGQGFRDRHNLMAEPAASATAAPTVADGFTLPAGRTWLALLPADGGGIEVTPAPGATGTPAP